MGHGRHPIRALGNFHCQYSFGYVQQVSSPVEMNNSKEVKCVDKPTNMWLHCLCKSPLVISNSHQ